MQMSIQVPIADQSLQGDLGLPPDPCGIVLFAHGSGSSRRSLRKQYVARALERRDLATLLIDRRISGWPALEALSQALEDIRRLALHPMFDHHPRHAPKPPGEDIDV
jgi:hypothetical protein